MLLPSLGSLLPRLSVWQEAPLAWPHLCLCTRVMLTSSSEHLTTVFVAVVAYVKSQPGTEHQGCLFKAVL